MIYKSKRKTNTYDPIFLYRFSVKQGCFEVLHFHIVNKRNLIIKHSLFYLLEYLLRYAMHIPFLSLFIIFHISCKSSLFSNCFEVRMRLYYLLNFLLSTTYQNIFKNVYIPTNPVFNTFLKKYIYNWFRLEYVN